MNIPAKAPAITPAEVEDLINWHELRARLSDQSDDLGGARYHRQKLAEWRAFRGVAMSSQETDNVEDAAKWRALRNCARISHMGSAGIVDPQPGNYAHLTLNFWTVHDAPSDPLTLEWFDKFVEIAQRAQATVRRNFVGIGELERTGYIPAGSAAEREAKAVAALGAAVDAQTETITSLCNRIDHINTLCHDRVIPTDQKLRMVEDWSDGFAHPPREGGKPIPFTTPLKLLDDAIAAMAELHRSAEPIEDDPEINAKVPAASFRTFTDTHANLLYQRARLPEETLFQAHTKAVGDFLSELAEYLGLNGHTAKPADFITRAAEIRDWCADHMVSLDFVMALKIAEEVFEQYKKDQRKWWKRMDGTPILNDVAVRIATAFQSATRLPTEKQM